MTIMKGALDNFTTIEAGQSDINFGEQPNITCVEVNNGHGKSLIIHHLEMSMLDILQSIHRNRKENQSYE